jgi:hypothetical protein
MCDMRKVLRYTKSPKYVETAVNDQPKINAIQEDLAAGSNIGGSQESLKKCMNNLARHAADPDHFVTIEMADRQDAK